MHLINPLCAGVAGAENGSVGIYARGTSNRASTYGDFYGAAENQDSADFTLDANGRLVVYVNQLVDCVVRDSTGATLCQFTAGDETTAIQYSGTAFRGVDPVTGQTAINKPSVLKGILDLLGVSFGTYDGLVSFRGSRRNLYEAIAGLDCFFNVKDPLYGAVGDGTTDDTTAIQAALTAASAAGGGIVYMPAGTYKTSAVLTMAQTVSLLGSGSRSTLINQSHATAITLTTTTAATIPGQSHFLHGVGFKASVASTGIVVDSYTSLRVEGCRFGDDTNQQGTLLSLSSVDGSNDDIVSVRDCGFTLSAASQTALTTSATSCDIRHCDVVLPATYNGIVFALINTTMDACRFVASATAAGTYSYCSTYGGVHITNCTFGAPSAATATAITWAAGTLYEAQNDFGAGITAYGNIAASATLELLTLVTRESRVTTITSNVNPTVIPWDQYGTVYLIRTVTGAQVLTQRHAPVGANCKLVIRNNAGGNLSPSFTGDGRIYLVLAHGDASVPIADNNGRTHNFVSFKVGSDVSLVETAFQDATVGWA